MVSSCMILIAYGNGTDLARSLIKSLALIMLYGSQVYRDVLTLMEPSIKFNSATILNFFSSFFNKGQISLIYFSRYYGNRQEKLDSSTMPLGLYSGLNSSICHLSSVGSLSQGLSLSHFFFSFGPLGSSVGAFAGLASVICKYN
jgi:hypothetical protein